MTDKLPPPASDLLLREIAEWDTEKISAMLSRPGELWKLQKQARAALAAAPIEQAGEAADREAAGCEDRSVFTSPSMRETPPAAAPAPLDVNGVVAELMGVEAHLDNARERLIKTTNTLAALAACAADAGGEE